MPTLTKWRNDVLTYWRIDVNMVEALLWRALSIVEESPHEP
jgi:hypothetical protein